MPTQDSNTGRNRQASGSGGKAVVGIVGVLVVIAALVGKAALKGGKAAMKLGDEATVAASRASGDVATGAKVGAGARIGARATRSSDKDDRSAPIPLPPAAP